MTDTDQAASANEDILHTAEIIGEVLARKDAEITRLRAELAAAKADVAAMNGLYLDAAEKQRKAEAERDAAVQRAEEWRRLFEQHVKDCAKVDAALAAERAARERIECAAKTFVCKLDSIHDDPAFRSVWAVNQIHCGPYTGPTYTEELAALRQSLTTPAEASAGEATVREAALEEAAKVADECSYSGTGLWIADNIRALKSPPAIHDKTEG